MALPYNRTVLALDGGDVLVVDHRGEALSERHTPPAPLPVEELRKLGLELRKLVMGCGVRRVQFGPRMNILPDAERIFEDLARLDRGRGAEDETAVLEQHQHP